MAENAEVTVQQLFERWRRGDAGAGRLMAQRFSDWYYAITAVRLGDRKGRGPLDRSCKAFAEGVVAVTRAGDIVEWAYGLVQQEVSSAGGLISGGDIPNAITRNRSPAKLLRQVRSDLEADQLKLLHLVYSGRGSVDEVARVAEAQGGMPLALLRARYTLKRLLKQNADVPFQITPVEIDFDRCPMPLYEANALANPDEVVAMEKWLLTDVQVCRDVAEFATFAVAMRGGALVSDEPAETPVETARTQPVIERQKEVIAPAKQDTIPAPPTPAPSKLNPMVLAGIVAVVFVIAAIAIFLMRS